MNITEALKSVFANYANFDGRARRSEYWWFYVASFVTAIVAMVITPVLYFIVFLAVIIPSIAVAVRRMHDVGKSGWYLLIPIYNLILAFTEGETGTNEYGPDPKGSGLEEEVDAIGRN
jgi:uncharacterized membrane protein YhaH (DUF805 family)